MDKTDIPNGHYDEADTPVDSATLGSGFRRRFGRSLMPAVFAGMSVASVMTSPCDTLADESEKGEVGEKVGAELGMEGIYTNLSSDGGVLSHQYTLNVGTPAVKLGPVARIMEVHPAMSDMWPWSATIPMLGFNMEYMPRVSDRVRFGGSAQAVFSVGTKAPGYPYYSAKQSSVGPMTAFKIAENAALHLRIGAGGSIYENVAYVDESSDEVRSNAPSSGFVCEGAAGLSVRF
jgi:hypothetical protein